MGKKKFSNSGGNAASSASAAVSSASVSCENTGWLAQRRNLSASISVATQYLAFS